MRGVDARRSVHPEVERVVVVAEQVGQHAGRGAHLVVAVLVGLHDARVQAQRHVVHEHAPVHRGEIDPPLESARECVEGADDVVAVDAEVEREVVPGARGDAHEGHVEVRGHAGNEGL